jgi:hypothetical protein
MMAMRTHLGWIALLLVLAAPATAGPAAVDTLAALRQHVALRADGDAVVTESLVLAADGPGRVLLPFGFERADSFVVASGDAAFAPDSGGVATPLVRMARRRLLALELGPTAKAGDSVAVRCRVRRLVDWAEARGEFGAYALSRTFVNDADLSLGSFRLALVMPPGFSVRRITATEPTFKAEESPVPPYAVGVEDNRRFASVTAAHLRPGGRARLAIQAERGTRGPVPLVAGLVLAVLYLWFFRDVLLGRGRALTATGRR